MKKMSLYLFLLTAACASPALHAWSWPSWATTTTIQSDECADCAQCAQLLKANAQLSTTKKAEQKLESTQPKKTLLDEMKRLAVKADYYAQCGARAVTDAVISVPGVRTVTEKIGKVTADIHTKAQAFIDRYPRISEAIVWGAIAGSMGGFAWSIDQQLAQKSIDSCAILKGGAKGALIGIGTTMLVVAGEEARVSLSSFLLSYIASAAYLYYRS